MSYTPTEWKAGDTVTSAKLNKIEQALSNNVLIVDTTFVLTEQQYHVHFETNITAEEIRTAFCNGKNVLIHFVSNDAAENYSIYGELYLQMVGWASAYTRDEEEYDEQFMFDSNNIGPGFGLLQITEIFIENGKLCFPVYVD